MKLDIGQDSYYMIHGVRWHVVGGNLVPMRYI